jgi:hypothetical protein
MVKVRFRVVMVLGIGAALLANAAQAQPPVFPKPGPEQARLKQFEGEWDATVKVTAEPGKPAMESKATLSSRMDVGGFWLLGNFKGEMLGQTFQGHSVQGYDQARKKYVGIWVDSMSQSIMNTEGSFDKDGKVYTEHAESRNAEGKLEKMKMTSEFKDKDHVVFTMYMISEGKEVPFMVIDYRRKK